MIKHTVCPRSLDQFYLVSHYLKWGKTSWTYSTKKKQKKTLVFNATGNADKLTDPVKSKNYIII